MKLFAELDEYLFSGGPLPIAFFLTGGAVVLDFFKVEKYVIGLWVFICLGVFCYGLFERAKKSNVKEAKK